MTAVEAQLDLDDRVLGKNEMMAFTGITYRQLDYWTRQGVLRTVWPAQGSGSTRLWSIEQARIARAIARLTELNGRTSHSSIVRMAADAVRRGEMRFDLIPGVTVDLEVLLADDPAAAS